MNRDPSSTASYATSAFAALAGYSVNELVALGGFLLAVLTFAVNTYYKRKMYHLALKGTLHGPARDDH